MSSAGTQDNMRPFSHALPQKGTDVPASERSRKRLFAFLGSEPKFVWLNKGLRTLPKQLTGCTAQASYHDPECIERRKDDCSYRKRVEVTSARLPQIHGVVVASPKPYQARIEQRVPSVIAVSVTHTQHLLGWVYLRPRTLRLAVTKYKESNADYRRLAPVNSR